MINNSFLHPKVESRLKQVIFGDLVSDKLGFLYKNHTQNTIGLIKKLAAELNLSQSDAKILIAAAYGLHWGCVNLFNTTNVHFDNPFKHRTDCLRLASSKLERFLNYHASKEFSQKEILEIVKVIEAQALKSFTEGTLSSILFEATLVSWAEMISNQELLGVSNDQRIELVKTGKSYLKLQLAKLKSESSKQIIQKIL